jgi:hypothetical protein
MCAEQYMCLAIAIAIGITFFLGCRNTRRWEIKNWNGGISAKTGIPWRLFDHSSQGCRGYTDGENYIWISYKVDKR